jgi:hypothetical protein
VSFVKEKMLFVIVFGLIDAETSNGSKTSCVHDSYFIHFLKLFFRSTFLIVPFGIFYCSDREGDMFTTIVGKFEFLFVSIALGCVHQFIFCLRIFTVSFL